jgi:hypothetical protein
LQNLAALYLSIVFLIKMEYVLWEALKADRTVISSVSLMTLLTFRGNHFAAEHVTDGS